MRRTATTANAILGLLSLRPQWTTYELAKQLRRNMRFFWPRAESGIYDEAKRLVHRGLARAKKSARGAAQRTTYSISLEGRRAVHEWLATPPRPTALECEPLLRVFLADFATTAQLRAALDQVRADAEAIFDVGRVVGPEYLRGTAPFQDQLRARALVFDFLWSHAMMLRAWAERAERAVETWETASAEDSKRAALRAIRRHLAADHAAPGGRKRRATPRPSAAKRPT